MTPEVAETIEVQNKTGLHGRPAAEVVEKAGEFQAEITLQKGSQQVNAKSIMGVLTLAAEPGTRLQVQAAGPQAREAVQALTDLLADPTLGQEFEEETPAHKRG